MGKRTRPKRSQRISPPAALRRIAAELSQPVWSQETLNQIADIVAAAGYLPRKSP